MKIKKQLLIENTLDFIIHSYETVEVNEGEKGDVSDFLKLTGVFQKGNTPNGNNRIYKTELLQREVKKFQSKIKQGVSLGKAYHPSFMDVGGASGTNDVSHKIIKLEMDGDIVKGEMLIAKTESGRNIEAIYEIGGKVGTSSRGYGTVEKRTGIKVGGKKYKEVMMVQDDYDLETFDLVLTPSVKKAIMHPVKEESDNLYKEDNKGGLIMTLEELKAQHPELYNTVHEAGVAEGRKVGESEGRSASEISNGKIVNEKSLEIKTLKENAEIVDTEKSKLVLENKELVAKIVVFEAEKIKGDIKAAVVEAINTTSFKDSMGENEIADICRVVSTVEDAKKECVARIRFIESVIEKQAVKHTETGSKKIETSESGGSNSKSDKDIDAVYIAEQRAAAFGG